MITVTLIKKFNGYDKCSDFQPRSIELSPDQDCPGDFTDAEGQDWRIITGSTAIFDENNRLIGYRDCHFLRNANELMAEYQMSEEDAERLLMCSPLRVAYYWTEKATGTKWFERFDKVGFPTHAKRREWLDAHPHTRTCPRNQHFMPLEEAEATRKEFVR